MNSPKPTKPSDYSLFGFIFGLVSYGVSLAILSTSRTGVWQDPLNFVGAPIFAVIGLFLGWLLGIAIRDLRK